MSIGTTLASSANVFRPPEALLAKIKARERKLQMLPEVAVEAVKLAKKPDCTIAEYASVVERDVKLATDILKISNSAAFNPTVPIKSLKQAVLRLGLNGCEKLILTASYAALLKRLSTEQEKACTALWKHSYQTALLASYLNETFQLGFKGEEFACGLTHDFGRVLLAVVDPENFTAVDLVDFNESSEQLVREEFALGTDHCRLGAWYASRQGLPHPIAEVILRHHQPEKSKSEQRLTSLIAVADHMSNHIQRTQSATDYAALNNPFLASLSKFGDLKFETKFAGIAAILMEKSLVEIESANAIYTQVGSE